MNESNNGMDGDDIDLSRQDEPIPQGPKQPEAIIISLEDKSGSKMMKIRIYPHVTIKYHN